MVSEAKSRSRQKEKLIMKTIRIKAQDATYELHAYKAGESVEIFKGSTGTFGKAAGSKTAGLVYVIRDGQVTAIDQDVDHAETWEWIQKWMQKGMDAEREHAALVAVAEAAKHCLAERDCKSPINSDSVLRHALANLAAVREGGAK
jgi:hypothetical protein